MDKKTIKYFWSFFESVSVEYQILFSYKNGVWKDYKISINEKTISGGTHTAILDNIAKELDGADIYIVHNHPTLPPKPSNPDHYHCRYVQSILGLYNLPLTDYLIVSPFGYYSFTEAGVLPEGFSYQSYFSDTISINTPPLGLEYYVNQQKETILSLSDEYTEFIYSKNAQYGTKQEFDPSFLVNKEDSLEGRLIFFRKNINGQEELERLHMINRLLDPIEIYWIKDKEVIPLKLEGLI